MQFYPRFDWGRRGGGGVNQGLPYIIHNIFVNFYVKPSKVVNRIDETWHFLICFKFF